MGRLAASAQGGLGPLCCMSAMLCALALVCLVLACFHPTLTEAKQEPKPRPNLTQGSSNLYCLFDMDVRQCFLFKSDTEMGDTDALIDYGCCSIIKSRCSRKVQCQFANECPNIKRCRPIDDEVWPPRVSHLDYETLDQDEGRDLESYDLLSELEDYE